MGLADGLPPKLEDLELSFEGCIQIDDAGLQALTRKFPTSITRLRINVMGCTELTDVGILALAQGLGRLTRLQEFQLVCYLCKDLTADSFVNLNKRLPKSVQKCIVQMKGTPAAIDCKNLRELQKAAKAHLNARLKTGVLTTIAVPGVVSR